MHIRHSAELIQCHKCNVFNQPERLRLATGTGELDTSGYFANENCSHYATLICALPNPLESLGQPLLAFTNRRRPKEEQ